VAGALVLRYGLVLVIGWIGLMKFTGYEAKGIEPLVAHSPFMSWMYTFLSVQTFSDALGAVEVTIAIMIGLRHWSPKASALGSAGTLTHAVITLFWAAMVGALKEDHLRCATRAILSFPYRKFLANSKQAEMKHFRSGDEGFLR
jgi:uncharacterized membrane protein YkgB